MSESEFKLHPILAPELGDAGMHLKRGGAHGATYAAVTVMLGEPWLTILNLHRDTTKLRIVPCDSEMEATQAVECWLEGLLTNS